MKFDPARDTQALRAKLVELSEIYKISTETLLYRVGLFAKENGYPKLVISRPTLDRFAKGEDIKGLEALATIWAFFEAGPVHEKIIAHPTTRPAADNATSISPSDVNAALRNYYSLDPHAHASISLSDCGFQFSGYFAMYRRHWSYPEKIVLSIASIEDSTNRFAEITNAMGPDGQLIWYLDYEGFLFARGHLLHFLMRESSGSGIYFGTIDTFTPFSSIKQVTRMTGVITGATHQAVLPGTRFFCQRRELWKEPFTTGIFERNEIDCEEALHYLFDDKQ